MSVSPIHIGHLIEADLRERELPVAWFAKQIGVTRQQCYRIFDSWSIDTLRLMQISKVLQRDYFALYTDHLNELRAEQEASNAGK